MVKQICSAFVLSCLILTGLTGCKGVPGSGGREPQLVSLSITPASSSIAIDTDQQFTVTGIYVDNTTKDLTDVVQWTSSDSAIATVGTASTTSSTDSGAGPGHVYAKGEGSATITATWYGISASADLKVKRANLVSISISPTNPAIARSTNQQFTATGTFEDNTTQDLTASVKWTSSNTSVATISNASGSYGLAAALAAGSTTITAAWGNLSDSTTLTVNQASLVSIAITPNNSTIAKGSNLQFTATGTYSDNTTQNLTASVVWSSSNTSVATISSAVGSTGLATAVDAGSSTITAASGSISGTTTLTVNPASLVSVAVTPTNPGIAKGTNKQFTATGTYSDNTTQNLTASVVWSSSNTAVATISNAAGSNGLASAAGTGTTTITATTGSISGTTALTVTPASLVSISVTPANPAIAKGTNQQFTATGTYSDNTTQNLTASVTWSSSNTGAATISNAAGSNGLATSVAAGSTTITATSGSISGTTTLTVNPASLLSIAVTPANPAIAKGTNQQFTATGTYSDSTTQNLTNTVTWSSSNTGVATISNAAGSYGLATSVAAGTTTIKAASGSTSGSTTLTVNPASLVSIKVTPANTTIAKGATQQFTATGTYSDNSTQTLTNSATWSSSNTGVATVSNAAGSNGLATAVATGTTTVSAVSGGVTGSTSLTVVDRSATLTWDAPTTNTDGTALSDLKGYKLRYGTASGNYGTTIDVSNVTTYTINNLSPGTYYLVVSAYNTAGTESDYSNEAYKTIQ
jgi:uncharacterized protein YjdB